MPEGVRRKEVGATDEEVKGPCILDHYLSRNAFARGSRRTSLLPEIELVDQVACTRTWYQVKCISSHSIDLCCPSLFHGSRVCPFLFSFLWVYCALKVL